MTRSAYPLSPADVAFLSSWPFEHHWRYSDPARFVDRLQTERNLHDAGFFPDADFGLTVIVLRTGPAPEGLGVTLRSIALQSCPAVDAVVCSSDPGRDEQAVGDLCREGVVPAGIRIGSSEEACGPGRFVCFVRSGDVLHPSLAHAVALGAGDSADVVVWNDIEVPSGGRPRQFRFVRRPRFERHTLRHMDYLGMSFAVRAAVLDRYEGGWMADAQGGSCRFLTLWLAESPEVRWASVFDFLAIRHLGAQADSFPPDYARQRERYLDFASRHWGEFELRETGEAARPYVLIPRRKPQSIGVVIPFRDKPELTLRSARSVLGQRASCPVKVTLVDNRSSPESVGDIRKALDAGGFGGRYEIVAYDLPFNHSAQCNLGAERARSEVVVFLNNDARLMGDEGIEDLASWALLPDVATVGLRIEDESGRLVCAGLRLRLRARSWHESPFEENVEERFAGCVRETGGNTFAVVAVETRKFDELGRLDARRFPNGFNDAEFSLRSRRAGYAHIYLGRLRAVHHKSQSRGRTDEISQKLGISQRYPETIKGALEQLTIEVRLEQLRWRHAPRAALGRIAARVRSNSGRTS